MLCTVCRRRWHVPSQGGVIHVNELPVCSLDCADVLGELIASGEGVPDDWVPTWEERCRCDPACPPQTPERTGAHGPWRLTPSARRLRGDERDLRTG